MEFTNKPKESRQARDWHSRRACKAAHQLERTGDDGNARLALREPWSRIGERPVIDELSVDTQAEVLLRVGAQP